MMFALRGLAVSLAFFLAFYCALSLLVSGGWEFADEGFVHLRAKHRADLLFLFRILPVIGAGAFTVLFVVPSFLLLEPRTSPEGLGEIPVALAGCALLWLGAGGFNAGVAYIRARNTVIACLADATLLFSRSSVPVFCIRLTAPTLTLVGIGASKVLLSEAAAKALTAPELDVALEHEIAHARRRDNLKKLLFRLCTFPGMSPLEFAWAEAEEMAADDAAVTCVQRALDLASALIKLSRLAPVYSEDCLTTSLAQRPAASVNRRIERLMTWNEERVPVREKRAKWYATGALLGAAVMLVPAYVTIIQIIHLATEWMVE